MNDVVSRTRRRQSTIRLIAVTMFVFVTSGFGVGLLAYRGVQSTIAGFRMRDFTCAACWRDEIYFTQRVKPEEYLTAMGRPNEPCQVMAIDFRTGILRETGIEMPEPILGIVADTDRLWVVCRNEVVEIDDANVTRSFPKLIDVDSRKLVSRGGTRQVIHLFLMNHRLAAIVKDQIGRNRLYTFENGDWQAGPQIASPGSNRRWAFDREKNQICLVPSTTTYAGLGLAKLTDANGFSTPSRNDWESLIALQAGHEIHLISISQNHEINESGKSELVQKLSYRSGFDFVADEGNVLSALAPENELPDTTGWRLLDPDQIDDWQIPINLAIIVDPQSFARTRSPSNLDDRENHLVQHPSSTEIYLISEHYFQSFTVLKRIDDHFEPFPFSIRGLFEPWLANDTRVVWIALTALAFSRFVLLAGADRIASKWSLDQYSFGNQVVVLAPLGRRWIARGIDLFAQWIPLISLFIWAFAMCNLKELMLYSPTARAYTLFADLYQMRFPTLLTFSRPSPIRDHALVYFRLACSWIVLFAMISAITQGRSGLTLGKWMCGIRVVRTTLRPCGLARSLLRELLMCVDTVNLLSPIPAVIAVLMSSKRQRIGDRWADTIVIDVSGRP